MCRLLTLVFVICLWKLRLCNAAHILIMPQFLLSHFRDAEILAAKIESNGHKATVVVTDNEALSLAVPANATYQRYVIDHPLFSHKRVLDFFHAMIYQGSFSIYAMYEQIRHDRDMCEVLLQDKSFLDPARGSHLILGEYEAICSLLVGELLNKPVVAYFTNIMTFSRPELRFPLPVSYVPVFGSGYTNQMSFAERLSNLIQSASESIVHEVAARILFRSLVSKYNISTEKTALDILGGAELYLVFLDFIVEYPHPLSPDVIYVGSMTAKPSNRLPDALEEFITKSGSSGVIVVSFGAIVEVFCKDSMETMAKVFSHLKQAVVWKVKAPGNFSVPGNVLIQSWIPQNDLLGHPLIKVFVTHGGARSMQEAVYHGVPMVVVPLFADQFDNAVRIVHRLKVGRQVDFLTAGVEEWLDAITDIINTPRYKENAMAASKLTRANKRDGLTYAMELLNYTLECGGRLPHLRIAGRKMWWFSYYSVDVASFLLLTCMSILISLRALFQKFKQFAYLCMEFRKNKRE